MEVDVKDAIASYNKVIEKYWPTGSPLLSSQMLPFVFVEIVKIGYGLFLLNEQDDPDVRTLRQFCRERQ